MPDTSGLEAYATNAANQNGVPVPYFLSFLQTESGFDPNAIGSKGEQGIAQIIPAYHPDVQNAFNPYESMDYAAKTLAAYAARFGNWESAFASWNAGPHAVETGQIPTSTQSYVNKIIGGGLLPSTSVGNPQSQSIPVTAIQAPNLPEGAKTFGLFAGLGLLLIAFLGMKGKGV